MKHSPRSRMSSDVQLTCPVCCDCMLDLEELREEGCFDCTACGAELELHGEQPWHIWHYGKPLHRYVIYLDKAAENLLPNAELYFDCHAEIIDGKDNEPIEAMVEALQGVKNRLEMYYDAALREGNIDWYEEVDDGITEFIFNGELWTRFESKRCGICNERLLKLPYGWENGVRIDVGEPGIWQCRTHGFGENPENHE